MHFHDYFTHEESNLPQMHLAFLLLLKVYTFSCKLVRTFKYFVAFHSS